jgi:hypothetical protein
VSTPLHTVHVRVNDAATGQPTPCRIRFANPEGRYFPPLGRLSDFATGPNEDVGGNLHLRGTKYAFIDGACEAALPATPVLVEIHKGPEYQPVRQQIALGPGKLALRFELKRLADLRQEGWYSGDIRAFCLSPHAALLEAAAEDLAIVNLLATDEFWIASTSGTIEPVERRKYPAIPNILAFSGQKPALEMPGHLVAVNTYNRHPVLGSLALLHSHRAVYPLSFGGPDGWDSWTLADWCDQCHRKNGLVVWAQPLGPSSPVLSKFGEPLADLVLGKIDAFDWRPGDRSEEWYRLLDAGFRLPLVAGSAKCSNREVLGGWRTYARLRAGEQLSCSSWIEAVRSGRTFVTGGPLLRLTVNGQAPGATVELPDPAHKVHVRAECQGLVPLVELKVLFNGVVVASSKPTSISAEVAVEAEVDAPVSGWIAALCRTADAGAVAHTSPVHVRVRGHPPRPAPGAVRSLIAELERMLDWVREEARCETDKQRDDLAAIFQDACHELRRRLGQDSPRAQGQ